MTWCIMGVWPTGDVMMCAFAVVIFCRKCKGLKGRLGTVDFHTSEQWTFDIIHCYFKNCKRKRLGVVGWGRLR